MTVYLKLGLAGLQREKELDMANANIRLVLNRSPAALAFSSPGLERLLARKANLAASELEVQLEDFLPKRRPIEISGLIRLPRNDPALIATLEELGPDLTKPEVELQLVEIPPGSDWQICDLCGIEFVSAAGEVWPKGD